MKQVCMRPTYGNPIAEVYIQPPLDEGEEKLLRLKAKMYGKEVLMIAHSERGTTCQFGDRLSNIEHMLGSVFDPFNDNLANIHWDEEGSRPHTH